MTERGEPEASPGLDPGFSCCREDLGGFKSGGARESTGGLSSVSVETFIH